MKTKTYLIPKGKHHSTRRIALHFSNQLNFTITFDKSAIYQTKDPKNQWDINKIFGFNDCYTHHHHNSARIGWRYVNQRIELWAYCYRNGERIKKMICDITEDVKLENPLECSISINENYYDFSIRKFGLSNSQVAWVPRKNRRTFIRYLLFPYFGGDETAPHDIQIAITK